MQMKFLFSPHFYMLNRNNVVLIAMNKIIKTITFFLKNINIFLLLFTCLFSVGYLSFLPCFLSFITGSSKSDFSQSWRTRERSKTIFKTPLNKDENDGKNNDGSYDVADPLILAKIKTKHCLSVRVNVIIIIFHSKNFCKYCNSLLVGSQLSLTIIFLSCNLYILF